MTAATPAGAEHVDVLIVGAGISGISAAYHLQSRCPGKSYAILEARKALGGTWDLFRYPGIRSDSDMYTLGFSFRPWRNPQAIADGPSILAYVRDAAEAYGIDRRIRYDRKVVRARWSSRDARWSVDVVRSDGKGAETVTCGFLFMCAGYYDYDAGHAPDFEGTSRFRGRIVHPQHWSPDIDYDGKRVVIIGSGATAVTLAPELAKRAAHVTMLQRSPTYIVAAPDRDPIADWLRERLPASTAYAATRWKNVALAMALYTYCRRFPNSARKLLVGGARRALGPNAAVEPHFTPTYQPWDQRLCLAPNGDIFAAIRDGRVSVVTDHIDQFVETGLKLKSGARLEADLVVTATGLRLKFLGGLELEVDGHRVEPSKTMAYKGMMCSDVPNLALAIGYTNASWTLKCDLTSAYVCRLLSYMDDHGYTSCCPRRSDPSLKEEPLFDFSSGYVQRAIDDFPRQGSFAPWRVYQNYALDKLMLGHATVADESMQFARAES